MSLKQELKEYVKTHGYMPLNEFEFICKKEGRKQSNGERRMRELSEIEPIFPIKKNGAIIGYKWGIEEELEIEPEPIYNFNGQLIK